MFYHEDFVVESFEKYEHLVDENDNYNYKYVEQPINIALIDSDVDDVPPCKIIRIESISESVFASDESIHESCQQQTTLSEYSSELPWETSIVDLERDEPVKMVNVPLLLHQLRSARVALERLPDQPIDIGIPIKKNDNPVRSPTPTCKIGVQRYCHKCKTLDIDYNRVMTAKICSNCRTTLIYVCDKCNEHHYRTYECLRRHRIKCRGDKTGKSLDNVVVVYCSECPFQTSYGNCMKRHMKITGHKALDGEEPSKLVTSHIVTEVHVNKQRRKLAHSARQLKYLVKWNEIDYSIARKRYCPKCAKTVASHSSIEDETCDFCRTTLLYQCGKCDHRYARNDSFSYHAKSKCYPSEYRCSECHYTASIWCNMHRHLKTHKAAVSMSLEKKFTCKYCSFGTDYERSLVIHLKKIHKKSFA